MKEINLLIDGLNNLKINKMKFGDKDLLEKDKVEIVKQQQAEIQKVLDSTLRPSRGHTLFEVNTVDNTIKIAEFDELPAVKWEDALKGNISVQKKVTKKDNCIYISALNKNNVLKILKRDYNITI
jgi:hypothetical protein